MTKTVTPKTVDDREGFKMLRSKSEEGFCKGEGGVDNKMEGDDRNSRFLMKPLEVMFGSYLNRSGFCEGEMGSRALERAMI